MSLDLEKRVPWMDLLLEALNAPGMLSTAYSMFHRYSVGNMILAMLQLGPGLAGPLATYKGWQAMGRQVSKGQKAIALYMPVMIKGKSKAKSAGDASDPVVEEGGPKGAGRRVFILRRNWFSLAQTDGEQEPAFDPPGDWKAERALAALGIQQVPFELHDGNVLGYATKERTIAVSPLSPHPDKTRFHEMAHVLLHVGEGFGHGERPPQDVREVEAEATAYIVCCMLGCDLEHLTASRGYIQAWMSDPAERDEFAKKHASRVFSAAQRIIQAGKARAVDESTEDEREAA